MFTVFDDDLVVKLSGLLATIGTVDEILNYNWLGMITMIDLGFSK